MGVWRKKLRNQSRRIGKQSSDRNRYQRKKAPKPRKAKTSIRIAKPTSLFTESNWETLPLPRATATRLS